MRFSASGNAAGGCRWRGGRVGSDRGWGPSGTASRVSVEGCWGGVEVLFVVVVWEVEVFVVVVVANLVVVDARGWVFW